VKTLVRVSNWLGDAVMNTAAISAIRAQHPDGHLAVLAIPWVAEIFRHHPDVDDIIVYDREGRDAGFRGAWSTARRVRAVGFDRAYVFPNSFSSAVIPFLARVPERIGYAGNGRSPLLTDRKTRTDEDRKRHHVKHYLALAGATDPDSFRPRLCVSGEEVAAARDTLAGAGLDPEEGIAGLAPGAAYGPAKQWFPDRFAAAGERLRGETGCGIAIFGSEGDRKAGAEAAAGIPGSVLDQVGKTSLRELMALLSLCRVLITNDSGTMHLAAALGTPVVAVFGSTEPDLTGPVGGAARGRVRVIRHRIECSPCFDRTCRFGHYRCMKLVEVSEVVEAAREVMQGKEDG
jgi:heptosyltransferase-2